MSSSSPMFRITVILAEAPDASDPRPALLSIERATSGIATEVLLVRPAGGVAVPASSVLTITECIVAEETLVPQRWGTGVRAASAPVFACLTTEFTVHAEWATSLLAALESGAVGAAGAIDLTPASGSVAAAIYLSRFSPYLPSGGTGSQPVSEIPGDTAAYQLEAVVAFPDLLAEGFWEVEFHRRFRAGGQVLVALRQSLATFGSGRGIAATLLMRYRHGLEFGENRVLKHKSNRWRIILGAPVVPVILVGRIVARAMAARQGLLALRAFGPLVLINTAWAAGEAVGAWRTRTAP